MATLMKVRTSGGYKGRCDARCYNAKGPDCDCCCGGVNHGVGLKQAIENTRASAEAQIATAVGHENENIQVVKKVIQESLF